MQSMGKEGEGCGPECRHRGWEMGCSSFCMPRSDQRNLPHPHFFQAAFSGAVFGNAKCNVHLYCAWGFAYTHGQRLTSVYRGVLVYLGNLVWKHGSSTCGCVGAQVTKSHAMPVHAELVVHGQASALVRLPTGASACCDQWFGLARLNVPIVSPGRAAQHLGRRWR